MGQSHYLGGSISRDVPHQPIEGAARLSDRTTGQYRIHTNQSGLKVRFPSTDRRTTTAQTTAGTFCHIQSVDLTSYSESALLEKTNR
jgi:hypothetical protein